MLWWMIMSKLHNVIYLFLSVKTFIFIRKFKKMSLYYCSINLSKGERSENWYTLDGRKTAWDYVERMLTAISQVGFFEA
jgi:hypothetical protein